MRLINGGQSFTITIPSMYTPKVGPINGTAFLTAGGSDVIDLAQVFVGPTSSSLTQLGNSSNPWNGSPPYNRQTPFLVGLICIADPEDPNLGLLDTRGTMGTHNLNPYTGSNPAGTRVWQDITAVSISSTLQNNQSTLVLKQVCSTPNVNAWYSAIDFGVQVDANSPVLSVSKSVDQTLSYPGFTLTYTLNVANLDSDTASNILFYDTLPSLLNFVANSLQIGTTPNAGNPALGITLPDLGVAQNVMLTFQAQIATTVTAGTTLSNNGFAQFAYYPTPTTTIPLVDSALSNTVTTAITLPTLLSTKTANPNYATLGDTLTYTISLSVAATTLTNVILFDTIPQQTAFIPGSVTVNGLSTSESPTPPTGINIGVMNANTTSTVTFQVLVTTLPTTNPIGNLATLQYEFATGTYSTNTNTASTTLIAAILSNKKTVNRAYADLENILTYTVALSNIGNTTANNILFIDTLPTSTTLVANSFMQDGITIAGSPNPPGVTLPLAIPATSTSSISFQVLIYTLPVSNPLVNSATETYNFIIDTSTTPIRTGSATSQTNTVTTQVNHADLSHISKYTNRLYASCQDTITYTIAIPNLGTTTAQNVFFIDTIPSGTTFTSDSLTINDTTILGANPSIGLTLPDIAPGSITTITFKVLVQC